MVLSVFRIDLVSIMLQFVDRMKIVRDLALDSLLALTVYRARKSNRQLMSQNFSRTFFSHERRENSSA